MRTLNNLYQAALKVDIQFLVENAMVNTSTDYIKKQQEQLSVGLRSDNAQIFRLKTGSTLYSTAYAKYVKHKDEPIDLHLTGMFYEDMFLDVRKDIFITDSADWKSQLLQDTYGKEIFGLNYENKGEYVQENLQPELITQFETALND